MGVLRKMCDAMGGFCVVVPAAAAWLAAAAPHGLAPPGPFFTPAGHGEYLVAWLGGVCRNRADWARDED